MDDLTSTRPARSKANISEAERARRKAAIDYASGSLRLEGFVASDAVEEVGRRYIDGELTTAEHSAAIRQRHGL